MVRIDGTYEQTNRQDYTEVDILGTTTVWLEEGDVLENYLFNTNNNILKFHGVGYNSYTVRNVGVNGAVHGSTGTFFSVGVSGEATIENCYFGDGCLSNWRDKHQGSGDAVTGCFTFSEHTGNLNVTDSYWGPWGDNTFYCENQGASGNVNLTRVFADGGCVSAYRLGGSGSHTITDCHHANPGQHPVENHSGQRTIWIRSSQNSDISVHGDTQFDCGGSGIIADGGPVYLYDNTQYCGGSGNIRIQDSTVGQSPNPYVPNSVPTDALSAATGTSSGGGGGGGGGGSGHTTLDPVDPSPYDATIVYRNEDGGTNSNGNAPRYYHQADGKIEETTDYDTEISDNVWQEQEGEYHASGRVENREAFRYNYSTLGLEAEDPIIVEINGQVVDPSNYGSPEKSTPPSDDDPDMARLGHDNFAYSDLTEYYVGNTDHFDTDQV